jgi:hypothetical protein
MNTEFSFTIALPVSGEVVVLQIEPEGELQLLWQNAATPPAPTAQTFPPEVGNVTALRPTPDGIPVGVTWFTGITVQVGDESSDTPCTIVG